MNNIMKLEYDGVVVNVVDLEMQKAIKRFISKLQKKKNNPRGYKKWTPEELATLEQMRREGNTPKQIAVALGRTTAGIGLKIHHLEGKPWNKHKTKEITL